MQYIRNNWVTEMSLKCFDALKLWLIVFEIFETFAQKLINHVVNNDVFVKKC